MYMYVFTCVRMHIHVHASTYTYVNVYAYSEFIRHPEFIGVATVVLTRHIPVFFFGQLEFPGMAICHML